MEEQEQEQLRRTEDGVRRGGKVQKRYSGIHKNQFHDGWMDGWMVIIDIACMSLSMHVMVGNKIILAPFNISYQSFNIEIKIIAYGKLKIITFKYKLIIQLIFY